MQLKFKILWMLLLVCVLESRDVTSQTDKMKQFISMFTGEYSIQSSSFKNTRFRPNVTNIDTKIHNNRAYVLAEVFLSGVKKNVQLMEIRDLNNKQGIMVYRIAPKNRWVKKYGLTFNSRIEEKDVSSRSHCYYFEYSPDDHAFISYETGCQSISGEKLFNITYMHVSCDGITYLQDVGRLTYTVKLRKVASYSDLNSPRWQPRRELC